ncbi:alpha-L-rhamnosidase-related protein [Sphingobacterium bovistauri]|uniref:Alpha-rhamnosidase n=1 Tax=Sphingobacterium bovistauri TaxID=2781959 RepID=A0ABS7Z3K8_9SPHI|nr:alpha-rhamnosidase [Sphingobacterium bovistauri]MCA5004738.1 alpha-rhamnosidase [Sphingobacterium bovistauri]
MKRIFLVLYLSILTSLSFGQQGPTWIWYPGDFEVWLSNDMQNRRTERGTYFPPFWKMDSHYVLVEFNKEFDLPNEEQIQIKAEGIYNVKVNGKMVSGMPDKLILKKGKQKVNIKVYNQSTPPALFVSGKNVNTDKDWFVTYEDKEWIDETGKASDASGTTYSKVGYWNFNRMDQIPSQFKLPTQLQKAVYQSKLNDGVLVDFGKNTFGFLTLHNLIGKGNISIYYGESKEEALDTAKCETLDYLNIIQSNKVDSTLLNSKGFRYAFIKNSENVNFSDVSMQYEYLPVEDRGTFRSSDDELNKIWEVSKYTMELTSREFYIDGIKRDRWIWSGDAYQSYAMNYYLGFDSNTVKRTILALRGKEPTVSHINTIMDYTFYWFLSIYDYYLYTGDDEFIENIYPRMKSMMEFCLNRRNHNGFMEGLAGDWVFIDWAEGLSKKGEVSFEQLLFCRSLETMALCAEILNKPDDKLLYSNISTDLKDKFFKSYWNSEKNAFVHSLVDGKQTDNVTKYTNMFAIFFDYLNANQKDGIRDHVLLNDKVQKIMTPYMRYYELEALCVVGEKDFVMKEMKNYWGAMLKQGATTFWEEYNPSKSGKDHLSMYGRDYGKSLCHSWGAGPIYLLGKYFLGAKPTSAGYKTYDIEPYLASQEWMEGKIPTPKGEIDLFVSKNKIKVQSPIGLGTLRIKSKTLPKSNHGAFVKQDDHTYSLELKSGISYQIDYKSL